MLDLEVMATARYLYMNAEGNIHGPFWLSQMRDLWKSGRINLRTAAGKRNKTLVTVTHKVDPSQDLLSRNTADKGRPDYKLRR